MYAIQNGKEREVGCKPNCSWLLPTAFGAPSVCVTVCTAQYIHSKTSWVEGSQEVIAGWRESNITICIIIFNNQLEKGHWHWTDILQLHFCFALRSVFVTVTDNSAFFFSPPSVSFFKLWLPGWALSPEGPGMGRISNLVDGYCPQETLLPQSLSCPCDLCFSCGCCSCMSFLLLLCPFLCSSSLSLFLFLINDVQ